MILVHTQALTSITSLIGHGCLLMIDPAKIILPVVLPITEREDEIVRAIRENQVVIIRGETGSGKTTQIPKLCLKAGLGQKRMLGCTQPRRVAAFAVANRIAEELGKNGEGIVGTKIRFSDQTSRSTRIKIMTDGILLNEMQSDPMLRQYDVIVVDEAHERSLNIDFILGHLIQIRKKRPDLKIIVTSATIDTQLFSEAFGGAPVIEVSGRMYPVELRYEPFEESDRGGDYTYIEACFDAIEGVFAGPGGGDILTFLPAEKDIRELCDRLHGAFSHFCEIVPLFGRLTQVEQQRIFKPCQRRKIVVATNIAETSLTVPGIRYVVDAGLARISRYSAHTRTQRLPIEAISQSSANQRMGRCGRVSEGVCIRLYSEEDFLSRPEYTQPEIYRSNLASVILRLKAFKFGDIESFPFLDKPDPRALQGGMILLKELSAIDEFGDLSDTGRKLARLPIDPTIGRMLLEAKKLNVQKSVLIIASALSIQDPRERPMEKEKEADREHAKFRIKDSDFLTLRQIWVSFDEQYEKWAQSKMRKFCRAHFISYQRLREWREIHTQVRRVLCDLREYRENEGVEDADAIHRCILAGLIGNVATLEDGNWYHATRGRKVMVFPGSVMFKKTQKPVKGKKKVPVPKDKSKQKKEWIMSAEFVETTRLFARSVAKIDAQWIQKAGEHLINYSYQEPHWSDKSQRVVVWKKEFLYGLLIDRSRVGFGKIDPRLAKEIFIRNGILDRKVRDSFPFLGNNQKLEDKIVEMQTRFRRSLSIDLEYKLHQFYERQLPDVSSVAEMHKWWRSLDQEGQSKLLIQESDLLDASIDDEQLRAFPQKVELGGEKRKIQYKYKPGKKEDGATLAVPLSQFAAVREGSLDWIVPGYVGEKVEQLLRALPKEYRKFLSPVRERCSEIVKTIKPSPVSLIEDLTQAIEQLYGIRIPEKAWDLKALPEHVKLKIKLIDEDSGKVVAHTSDWEELKNKADKAYQDKGVNQSQMTQVRVWKEAVAKWERRDVKDWSFGDLPEEIELGCYHGVSLMAYPGLVASADGSVSVRLFDSVVDARKYTPAAYRRLCEWGVGREVGWFKRDIKRLKESFLSFSDSYLWDDFSVDVERMVLGSLFSSEIEWPLIKSSYEARVEHGKQRLRVIIFELSDEFKLVGESRLALLNGSYGKSALVQNTLKRLLPTRFVRIYSFLQLEQLPRYMKSIEIRLKRAKQNPGKDAEKNERIQPLLNEYNCLAAKLKKGDAQQTRLIRDLFFALEEFRVSVYSQELGTKGKVSEKTIRQQLKCLSDLQG